MGLIEFFSDKDRSTLALVVAAGVVIAVGLLNKVLLRWFDYRPPTSRLAKFLFTDVGDGGHGQSRFSSGARLFFSVLSIVSILVAMSGLLLGVLVLAGAFDPPALKFYAAGAVALLAAGIFGIYYGGSSRGWPK